MSSLTPLLSPAKSPSSSTSPKGKWRPWSVPVKSSTVSRTLCGQLNKLTNRNFDVIANRVAQLTWTVELSEDRDSLNALVRAIFYRGATDVNRQLLYALLCRRVIDVLEAERSRWRKVDSLHIGKSVQSFETVITLLATDEYNRIRGYHVPEQLEKLAGFLGELLVYGVVATANMSDILASLVEGAKRNDERMAVATCRFLFPITLAYNAVHILGALKVTSLLDQALKEDGLSPMVRYLMMGMLGRVNSPTPHHAFSSAQPRVDMYPTALDEYFIDDDDGGDADVFSDVDEAEDNEWMQRDCEDWAKAFLIHHDDQHLGDILHSLRPMHRKQLVRCLISTSLYLGDIAEATSVGSLYSQPRIRQLCSDGKLFDEALCDELAILQDVRLDVPNAVYLMARVLHSTNINADKLRALVQSSMSSQTTLADELITETSRLEEGERMGRMGRSEEDTLATRN